MGGPNRFRRRLVVPAVLAASLLAACLSPSQTALDEVNADRRAAGLAAVAYDTAYSSPAQAQAQKMANANKLSHSSLSLAPGVCRAGENVGVGSSIAAVEAAFMASSAHRSNILDRRYDHVGIGVVERNGRFWVVLVFLDRC